MWFLWQVISCDILGLTLRRQTQKGWIRNNALVNKKSQGQADALHQWLQNRQIQFSLGRYEELLQAQDYDQVEAWLSWLRQFHKHVREKSNEDGVSAAAGFIVS